MEPDTESSYFFLTHLSNVMFKEGQVILDRDIEYLSSSSDNGDGCHLDRLPNSPTSATDASEDSVEMKPTPISIPKNKRKTLESVKVIFSELDVPFKKRIKFELKYYNDDNMKIYNTSNSTFRPWVPINVINPARMLPRHPGVTTLHRTRYPSINYIREQRLAMAALSKNFIKSRVMGAEKSRRHCDIRAASNMLAISLVERSEINTIASPPANLEVFSEIGIMTRTPSVNRMPLFGIQLNKSVADHVIQSVPLSQQRNYKNMTHEQRIEANARERTRVHTISAAFDTLRNAIPSYSNSQKLSKLSVLRVACAYILTLNRITGKDYSDDRAQPSIPECLDEVTKTIHTEGKIRK